HPTFLERLVDDGALDALDCHRLLIDAEDTRPFARRRADTAGEFRKIVRLVQALDGFFPQAVVNEIVPLRNEVIDGTAGRHAFEQGSRMAEWHTAIHAPRALLGKHRLIGVLMKFEPIVNALPRLPGHRQLAREFEKSGWLAHIVTFVAANLALRYCL